MRQKKVTLEELPSSKKPCISVVVPVHNAAPYLRRSLRSIQSQTYTNLDVILVDDGSTDGSSDILDAFARSDSRFRTIHRLHSHGVSAARNTAIQAARGEWIASADADDILPRKSFEMLFLTAFEHDVRMAMGSYRECHLTRFLRLNRPVAAHPAVMYHPKDIQKYFLTYGADQNHMWTKLFRRELFEHVRFPEGMIYEDIYVMPRLIDAAKSCAVINKPVYNYMVRLGSTSTNVNLEQQMDGFRARLATVEYMQEHYPEFVGLAYDSVLMIGCNILGKIEHIGGRKVAPTFWDEAVEIMRNAADMSAKQDLLYKAQAWSVYKDPEFLSKVSHFILKADMMI